MRGRSLSVEKSNELLEKCLPIDCVFMGSKLLDGKFSPDVGTPILSEILNYIPSELSLNGNFDISDEGLYSIYITFLGNQWLAGYKNKEGRILGEQVGENITEIVADLLMRYADNARSGILHIKDKRGYILDGS